MPKPMSRQTIIILRAPKWPPVSPRRSVRCFHHQLQHSEGVYVSSTSETRTDRAFGFSTGDEVASSRSQFQEIYISQSKVARQESQQQEQQREHRQQQEAEVSCSSDSSGKEPRDYKPPDERVIKLGQTLRRLSPLLPNILIHPLPVEILSPQVTLHLFPSTHPHLPTVKGRVLYRGALWTVPVAWGAMPLLGNVRLEILSERMVRADSILQDPAAEQNESECGEERFVVRWKTAPPPPESSSSSSTSSSSSSTDSTSSSSSSISPSSLQNSLPFLNKNSPPIFNTSKEGHFSGLFIFSFDECGRILTHTIEHAEQADGWDRTAKFVTLTDWLLGKAKGSGRIMGAPGTPGEGSLALDCCGRRRRR
ncbi:hypothetical protein VTN49DRAFT_7991 [Thermomyces lanuginosus]|uniref:uncharacterized protein n=1 Tax=Thermomyces lanuginosus TaxID=5541 RepID=UPI003744367D